MVKELEKRAREFDEGGVTVLDYVLDWVGSGNTLAQLADDINASLRKNGLVSRYMVSRYVNELPGGREALQEARSEGAHGIAESGIKMVDEAAENGTKEQIAGAKSAADFRLRMAGFWNKGEYQPQKETVSLNIDMRQVHLDTLRRRQVKAKVETQQLGDGTPDVEVVDGQG